MEKIFYTTIDLGEVQSEKDIYKAFNDKLMFYEPDGYKTDNWGSFDDYLWGLAQGADSKTIYDGDFTGIELKIIHANFLKESIPEYYILLKESLAEIIDGLKDDPDNTFKFTYEIID